MAISRRRHQPTVTVSQLPRPALRAAVLAASDSRLLRQGDTLTHSRRSRTDQRLRRTIGRVDHRRACTRLVGQSSVDRRINSCRPLLGVGDVVRAADWPSEDVYAFTIGTYECGANRLRSLSVMRHVTENKSHSRHSFKCRYSCLGIVVFRIVLVTRCNHLI